LTSIDYSGTTPDVTISYDRLGRRYQVTDAAGTRTFAYDASSLALTTETFGTGMFNGKVITQLYQDGTGGTVEGRFAGLQIGTSGDAEAYYDARYAYDSVGRLNHVTGPGLPTGDGSSRAKVARCGFGAAVVAIKAQIHPRSAMGSRICDAKTAFARGHRHMKELFICSARRTRPLASGW
jgi:YD repeat-containing protein